MQEKSGDTWAKGINKNSLAELRAMSADDVMKTTTKAAFQEHFLLRGWLFFSLNLHREHFLNQVNRRMCLCLPEIGIAGNGLQMVLGGDKPTMEEEFKEAITNYTLTIQRP